MTCNHIEQQQRQEYLEGLYALDGRDNPAHPLWGTYTGLYQQRMQQLVAADADTITGLQITADDNDTPLHCTLASYIGPGLIADGDAAAAVCAAWCRIVASRVSLAVRRLDPRMEQPASLAVKSAMAIADWLRHEAVRAELNDTGRPDLAPSCFEPEAVR